MRKFVIVGMLIAPLWAGAALAATTTPAAQTPPAAGKTEDKSKSEATKVHSPESIECSKQADAKGLHGKERKTFRSDCKKKLLKKS
jgi:hypothetical protein